MVYNPINKAARIVAENMDFKADGEDRVMMFQTLSGDLQNAIIKAAKEMGLEAVIKPVNPQVTDAAKICIYDPLRFFPVAKGEYFTGDDYAGVILKSSKKFEKASKFKNLVNEYSGANAELQAIHERRAC